MRSERHSYSTLTNLTDRIVKNYTVLIYLGGKISRHFYIIHYNIY